MNKIKLYLAVLLPVIMALQSCELESEVFNDINTSIYPTTERDARDLITGNVYTPFTTVAFDGTGENVYQGIFSGANGFHLLADMASDIGFCNWGTGTWGALEFGQVQPTTQYGSTIIYDKGYHRFFGKMLLTIDRIQGLDIDADVKARYIAEAKCGLGFLGFLFYDWYGPVVIPDLETLKAPQEAKILPRLSEDAMKTFIETNLKEAAAVLPATYAHSDPEYGRFTAGLAHMVLLKFYMQTQQWGKAITEGKELMKPEYGYQLVTDPGNATGVDPDATPTAYANIFSVANEGNSETIWAVNYNSTYKNEWFPNVLMGGCPLNNGAAGWDGYKIIPQFFATFEAGDQRRNTIISNENWPEGNLSDGVLPVKYEINTTGGNTRSALDWIVYRYADAITLLAEAIVRNGGDFSGGSPEPLDLLNQVRTRAGLTVYTAADIASKDDFIAKLLMERAHEFYFEGVRRQDLIRDGKYEETMKWKCNLGLSGSASFANPAKIYDRMPLPQSLITEGQGIIEQNPY
ncbi:MAG: RagB/SusD family nutrient uptake outer membrane protein [Prevotellaceae bacterium]|jgi:hypothetical protein|nr:RagB/SusD family nutrient uptake outer membrane protein [Prevotellaceae bacterium]